MSAAKRLPNTGKKTGNGVMQSPRSGAVVPTGAHPGNTGGKPGRSGRRSDAFKQRLEAIRDEKGMPVLEQVLDGAISYHLTGVCEHCGKTSTGPKKFEDVLKLLPSIDSRLRGVDLSLRYTAGLERVVRLEGAPDIQRAFDALKAVVRQQLEPSAAAAMLAAMHESLKHL